LPNSPAKLCNAYVRPTDQIVGVYYFTTLATLDPGKVARHRLFIRANEAEGVQVIYGEFKRKEKYCKKCHQKYLPVEEKQTDVNIALKLFELAVQDGYDKAVIMSGDTDLLPAAKTVRSIFPFKSIGVVIPIGRSSGDFKKNADFHFKMKEHQLQTSGFPDPVILADGTQIACPTSWN
jgi:uncharacterized LabA/DUF88 family protein